MRRESLAYNKLCFSSARKSSSKLNNHYNAKKHNMTGIFQNSSIVSVEKKYFTAQEFSTIWMLILRIIIICFNAFSIN